MAITDKTRKILWGRSGNRCAFCKRILVLDKTDHNSESIVGDEAHIVSSRITGPRGAQKINIEFDALDNLILLCKIHHKLIDDQPSTYTFEFLLLLKSMHEVWVEQTLAKSASTETGSEENFLTRIEHGKDLTTLFHGSRGFSYMYDVLETQETEEIVGVLLESISDYSDMWDEMGIGERISVEKQFDMWIATLEANEYWIFAGLNPELRKDGHHKIDTRKSFIIAVKKSSNRDINRKGNKT